MTPLFQSILAKHFWFQESKLLTLQICSVCSRKVLDFHLFYSNVEKLNAEVEAEENLNEDMVVKNEPLDSELDSQSTESNLNNEREGSNAEQLIVGGSAFEIVDTKAEPFEEVNIIANEVKLEEEDVKPELLVSINNNKTPTFECLNCDKRFEDKKVLELHMKIVHGDNTVARSCTKCTELEKELREVLEHGQQEVAQLSSPVQCVICDGRLQNMASLQRHLVWHWGETCPKCRKKPKNFNETTSKPTTKDSTQTKAFVCPYCKKDYSHINLLQLHMKIHHEKLSPPGCQKCKALDQALKDIEGQTPSEDTGRVKCSVCGGWLMNAASLQRHLTWHQSEPCENCRRGRRKVEAAVKQHVHAQKMPKLVRPPTTAASQAKKSKTDEVSIKHICVYCGLCFDVYAELVKHQVEEHPKKRNNTYISITPN
uniref:C2H2-type domain-containing protein n=1 Tax=Culex tarsalis TaxID=7177 RepID=A0A1Q3EXY4_CULTA